MSRTISIQPSPVVDHITEDGTELTRLPYPFHVDADSGDVQRQDFWRGDPVAVVGFQDDAAVQRVNLWWNDAAADPDRIIGKYPVMRDSKGTIYTFTIAIESVTVTEKKKEN